MARCQWLGRPLSQLRVQCCEGRGPRRKGGTAWDLDERIHSTVRMAEGSLTMNRKTLHLPLFFEFCWPIPEVTDDELAELQSEEERSPIGSYAIREIPPRGPRIELKATTLDEARAEAEEHWRKRTGLDEAGEPSIGYAIWDLYRGCLWSYVVRQDNKS
jgi:hypothetical protein